MFVKKILIDKNFPKLNKDINGIKICDSAFVDFYLIEYDEISFDRICKIYKILKKESIIIEFIEFCKNNGTDSEGVLTSVLTEELSRNIDLEIMKSIKAMQNDNKPFYNKTSHKKY